MENKHKDIHDFLILNGFQNLATDRPSYGNDLCNVIIEKDHYVVAGIEGNMYSIDLQIYWLIGVLTYYGYMNKNYKTLNNIA